MFKQEETPEEFEWRLKHMGLTQEACDSLERLYRLDIFGKDECNRIIYVQFTDPQVMKHRFDTPLKVKAKRKGN